MHSRANTSSPSALAHSLVILLALVCCVCAHLATAATETQQSVRLPGRFGKRADESESSAANLISKLIGGPDLGPDGRLGVTDPQFLSTYLSQAPMAPSAALTQPSPPPQRYVLVPVPIDRRGRVLYHPSTAAADRAGPWQ